MSDEDKTLMVCPPKKLTDSGFGWYLWCGRIFVDCPKGHRHHLDHAVSADGAVSPSVVCPEPDCGFHEHIWLDKYEERRDLKAMKG